MGSFTNAEMLAGRDHTDEDLMVFFQCGDPYAFDLLYEAYRGPVLGFLSVTTGERELAEEAIVQVFREVVRRRSEYAPSRRFRNWVYRIAVQASREAVRRRGVLPVGYEQFVGSAVAPVAGRRLEAIDLMASGERAAFRTLDDEAFRVHLGAVIAGLPEPDREVFILSEVERMSEHDAADVLGESEAEVRAALVRARRVILDLLRPPGPMGRGQ